MDIASLPIDIHSSQLLEWLIDRRHCAKNWQKFVLEIREKINHAIQDMPEDEKIVKLLQGTYIDYFHCVQIVDVLKDTEKDTKNFLGYYSSQRMKDWNDIIKLYKTDGVYFAEAAQMLHRIVQYEIPSLKRCISKNDQNIQDSNRKQEDYVKQCKEAHRNFHSECAKLGVKGESVRDEVLARTEDLPDLFDSLSPVLHGLPATLDYYAVFAPCRLASFYWRY